MTAGFITLRVDGGEVEEAIGVALEGMADLSGLFDALHSVWLDNAQRAYTSQGFGTWPSYYETGETQYAMAKGSILGRLMTRRDMLRWDFGASEILFPSMTDANHPQNVAEITSTTARFGTSVEYAINHHEGIGRGPYWGGSAPIPKRDLLLTDDQFLDDVSRATSNYAASALQGLAAGRGSSSVGFTKEDVLRQRVGRRGGLVS